MYVHKLSCSEDRNIGAIPLNGSMKLTEVALFMFVFVAGSPVRVPFNFASFRVLGAVRTLSARCGMSFGLRVETWFWPLTEGSVSVFFSECGKASVEHGRILFMERILGNFSDCAFSGLTYLLCESLKPCG